MCNTAVRVHSCHKSCSIKCVIKNCFTPSHLFSKFLLPLNTKHAHTCLFCFFVRVCRYLRGRATNMAIVDVEIPSGYVFRGLSLVSRQCFI